MGEVLMPKYNVSMEKEMRGVLKEVPGLDKLFAQNADYSRMAEGALSVGAINHKAVIEVTPSGVEAAAATSVSVVNRAAFGPDVSIDLDRPFLYFIVETSNN